MYRTYCVLANISIIAISMLSSAAYRHATYDHRCEFDATRILFDNIGRAGVYYFIFDVLAFGLYTLYDRFKGAPPSEEVLDSRYTIVLFATITGIVSCGLDAAFASPDPCNHGFGRR